MLEKGQETEGDCISQRSINILITLSLLLFGLPLRLQPICTGFLPRAITELSRRQVKIIHYTFQGTHFAASTSLTSLCRIRKCILSEYDTSQLVKHHKLLRNRFEKDAVPIANSVIQHILAA